MLGFARLPPPSCLTVGERQPVSLVGQGYMNHELATKLSIPTDHVGVELRSVVSKLGLRSLPALAIYAKRSNL